MDNQIISALLKKLVDRADEVDGDEAYGSIKPLSIEDANAKEPDEYHKEADDGDDDDTVKIVKLFK